MIWRENNWDKAMAGDKKWRETDKFLVSKAKVNKKQKGYMKKWRKDNSDKCREYNMKREKDKKHIINNEEWELCKKYFNYECAYCGLPIDQHYIKYKGNIKLGDFHKEHVDDNGTNDISNCVPSCKNCNSSKRAKEFEKWYRRRKSFSEERYNKIIKWLQEDWKITQN